MTNTDPELTSEFLDSLTRLSRHLRTLFNARVTAHGLTYPRARVLFRLARRSGMTQKTLAAELELEQPTVVRLLDRMEALGLIDRVPDPADRRAKQIVLTTHGTEQAALVTGISETMRDELFSGLPEAELRQAVALFETISERILEKEADDGGS